MDQVMSACARDGELDRIAAALAKGVILVDSKGEVVWVDEATRRRANGELQNLVLALKLSQDSAQDCLVSALEVTIGGEPSLLCIIQESNEPKEHDLVAAIQTVMADTSWFTRTIVEKLKALRQAKQTNERPPSDDIDVLSGREREVLGLICEGRSDLDMSELLRLSPNTVRNHIVSLYRKIGVNRRSAAIIWARERGITGAEVISPRRPRVAAPRMQPPGNQRSQQGK